MAATPLILGVAQSAQLAALRDLAIKHPVDVRGLLEAIKTPAGKERHMRQMDAQTVDIPVGFLVTLSIETGHPVGACRHMSMSSPRRGRLPTPEAAWMVAEHLGFVGGFEMCQHWIEELQRGPRERAQALNIVQPLDVTTASVGRH
jgi:hypothetical protein